MKKLIIMLTFSGVLFGCAGMNVKRDYDTSVDFKRLKTYAWQTSQETGVEANDNSLMEGRIRKATDAALAEKGYQKTSTGQADYLVQDEYGVEREAQSDRVHTGVGMGGGSGGLFGGISLGVGAGQTDREYEIISIGIVDPKTGKLLWQGSTREELTGSPTPEEITKRVNTTVKSILSKFPPK